MGRISATLAAVAAAGLVTVALTLSAPGLAVDAAEARRLDELRAIDAEWARRSAEAWHGLRRGAVPLPAYEREHEAARAWRRSERAAAYARHGRLPPPAER